jgi:hypothetical protein
MLATPSGEVFLVYCDRLDAAINVNLPASQEGFQVNWIDAKSGVVTKGDVLAGGGLVSLQPNTNIVWISRIE